MMDNPDTTVSLELVPRSAASVAAELDRMQRHLPRLRTVNIPDLLRFSLRSWEACGIAARRGLRAIPHLRAMDHRPDEAAKTVARLEALGLEDVLVVRGDAPQEPGRPVHPTSSCEWIRALRAHAPRLRIFAAFDPYRAGLRSELETARARLDAGANGFFTQPFFDVRLLEVCAEALAGEEVWWGFTPVLSARQRRYWETRNRVVFPAGFEPTLAWNRRLLADALAWVRAEGAHAYVMPIRADPVAWLGEIL